MRYVVTVDVFVDVIREDLSDEKQRLKAQGAVLDLLSADQIPIHQRGAAVSNFKTVQVVPDEEGTQELAERLREP